MFGSRRLITHTTTYAVAGIIGKALALVTLPILTRLLSAEQYGLADLAASLAATLTVVARFGGDIPAARSRALAQSEDERRLTMGALVVTTTAIGVVLAVGAAPFVGILADLWRAPNDLPLAGLALILIPIGAVQLALVTVVRLEGRAYATAALATIDLVAQMAIAVLLVIAGLGAYGVILGYVIGSIVGATAAAAVAWPYMNLSVDAARGMSLLRRGLPYLPSFVAFVFADQIARLVTADQLGPASVGYLAVAIRISSVMSLAVSAFSLAWGPLALSMDSSAKTAGVINAALRWYLALAALLSIIIGAFAPEITFIMAGPEYEPTAIPTPGLVWASALGGGFFILTTAAGIGQQGMRVAIASVSGAGVQIALAIVLVNAVGLSGIGIAALAGRIVGLGLLWHAVRRFIGMRGRQLPLLVVAGSVTVVALQALNESGDNATPIRLAIGAGAAITMIVAGYRSVLPRIRGSRESKVAQPGPIEDLDGMTRLR